MDSKQVPVFKPTEVGKHHFGDTEWTPLYSNFTNIFHINKIEDYLEYLNFPLPPHRKTVYDFIFLSHGESVRSKGLDKYEIGKNMFFFLPPFQITTHHSMSRDSKGFYCHFDPEILSTRFGEKVLNEFLFVQFISNPIVKIDDELSTWVSNILERLWNEYESGQSISKSVYIGIAFTPSVAARERSCAYSANLVHRKLAQITDISIILRTLQSMEVTVQSIISLLATVILC